MKRSKANLLVLFFFLMIIQTNLQSLYKTKPLMQNVSLLFRYFSFTKQKRLLIQSIKRLKWVPIWHVYSTVELSGPFFCLINSDIFHVSEWKIDSDSSYPHYIYISRHFHFLFTIVWILWSIIFKVFDAEYL